MSHDRRKGGEARRQDSLQVRHRIEHELRQQHHCPEEEGIGDELGKTEAPFSEEPMHYPEKTQTTGRMKEKAFAVSLSDDVALFKKRVSLQRVSTSGVELLDERAVDPLIGFLMRAGEYRRSAGETRQEKSKYRQPDRAAALKQRFHRPNTALIKAARAFEGTDISPSSLAKLFPKQRKKADDHSNCIKCGHVCQERCDTRRLQMKIG